ncbi:glycosyltransferase [Dyadobacter subterraneus]|uniref:Glycosyltransferase n=1 Tax=Dyadobacter subterraneus TaxID=2773304 RepID=A0ABR9WLK9_9BACT|nr:glycosyltransferase [Dyadobacter subterraneus]MBE9466394.1 glycosyltransferase [Dyadobacter subterraneus]
MTDSLLYVLCAFVLIQLFYYLFIFTRLAFYGKSRNYESRPPGVTVLVCAWNERENLIELLPLLDAQEYPEFEVILLDDRSDDGSEDYMRENIHSWKHIRYIRINDEFSHVTPKKYALTVGMKQAKYPLALMTDADCRPDSLHWITSMASQITEQQDIVIGFSPYEKYPGLLNWFIRCETFYTAVQYLSFSLAGLTYMGVGRNILYKTELFFANKGFYRHRHIMGGDDDIFLNEVATSNNTAISIEPESFVYSKPKTSWSTWLRQKRRHLAVSQFYRKRNKVMLGILSFSHMVIWLLGLVALGFGIFNHDIFYLQELGVIIGTRWIIQWILFFIINRKLDRTVEWFSFPLMDFAFFIYYIFFGLFVMTRRKPRTSWN